MPSKDAFSSNHDHEDLHRGSDELELSAEAEAEADPHPDTDRELRRTPSPSAMSKAEELKPTAGPHLEAEEHEPDSSDVPSVIDISGPPRDDRTQDGDHEKNEDEDGEEEVGLDTELTIRIDGNDGPESEAKPRPSDATEADAKAHTDAGSTLYGSFAAAGEHVHEHPLSLDTPSSRRRMKGDEEMGEYEYDEEDEDEEDDLGLGGAMGRGGRESPRGFVLTSGKVGGVQMQEFANKPRCVAYALVEPRAGCSMPARTPSSLGRPRIPHSAYYFGPPPPDAAYGTDPVGQIGVHHPREVVRVERDYSGGELPQFAPTYPLELEGRVSTLFSAIVLCQFVLRKLYVAWTRASPAPHSCVDRVVCT